MSKLLTVEAVCKQYTAVSGQLAILRDVSFCVAPSERIAIVGKSGSGKTTLLSIISGLERPSSGRVFYNDALIFAMSAREVSYFRNHAIGFVYQFHHLLPECTALENVMLPFLIRGQLDKKTYHYAIHLLTQVGLADRVQYLPGKLSGGERQRVAVARALVTQPKCVFLDEPTGNLDSQAALAVLGLLDQLCREQGSAFVMVTHDHDLARHADTTFVLMDGALKQQVLSS